MINVAHHPNQKNLALSYVGKVHQLSVLQALDSLCIGQISCGWTIRKLTPTRLVTSNNRGVDERMCTFAGSESEMSSLLVAASAVRDRLDAVLEQARRDHDGYNTISGPSGGLGLIFSDMARDKTYERLALKALVAAKEIRDKEELNVAEELGYIGFFCLLALQESGITQQDAAAQVRAARETVLSFQQDEYKKDRRSSRFGAFGPDQNSADRVLLKIVRDLRDLGVPLSRAVEAYQSIDKPFLRWEDMPLVLMEAEATGNSLEQVAQDLDDKRREADRTARALAQYRASWRGRLAARWTGLLARFA